jgi:hypothetical protein
MHSRNAALASLLVAIFVLMSACWDPYRACEEPHDEPRNEHIRYALARHGRPLRLRGGRRKPWLAEK